MDKLLLFSDTETTGFTRNGSHNQDGQARMCQVGLVLTDEEGNIRSQFSSLVKPDGWEISKGAYKCHGISMEECEQYGLPIWDVMSIYYWLAKRASTIVMHNAPFDQRIFEIEELHQNHAQTPLINKKEIFCTMEGSVNICRIPPTENMKRTGRYQYKNPKLTEALEILTGKTLENAHDAMADTMACKDIYFYIQRNVARFEG